MRLRLAVHLHATSIHRSLIVLLGALLILAAPLTAQYLDLNSHNAGGVARTGRGAGLSMAGGPTALDVNPAALAGSEGFHAELLQSFSQRRSRLEWQTITIPSGEFVRQRLFYTLDGGAVSCGLGGDAVIGISAIQRIKPEMRSAQHAITRSVLIAHELDGGIWAIAFGGAVRLAEELKVGVSVVAHVGTVESRLQGDNHGRDTENWAWLRSSCSGWGAALGLLWNRGTLGCGVSVETPALLSVRTEREGSANGAYALQFPTYDRTHWLLPAAVRAGIRWTITPDVSISPAVEVCRFSPSDVRFGLYEYGGAGPVWGTVVKASLGVTLQPKFLHGTPLHLAYVRAPQVYASVSATGSNMGNILVLQNVSTGSRIIQHSLWAGTEIPVGMFACRAGLTYSFLTWTRTVGGWFVQNDTYDESIISFSFDVSI